MATAKTSRPQPKSADIGARNSPKLERMPKDSTASRQPAAITTSGVRQPGSAGRGEAVDGEAVDGDGRDIGRGSEGRSEEHTSELQSLMRISYAVFCLQK